jgi:DNA-binding NtrC family response regulator
MKVLLIDDEPDILIHMQKALQILGHSCKAFGNPLAALNAFGQGDPYDVVISDVAMPEMNGFSVVSEIRRMAPATRLILISGHMSKATEFATEKFHSVVCMTKPIDVQSLKIVLDTIARQLQAVGN